MAQHGPSLVPTTLVMCVCAFARKEFTWVKVEVDGVEYLSGEWIDADSLPPHASFMLERRIDALDHIFDEPIRWRAAQMIPDFSAEEAELAHHETIVAKAFSRSRSEQNDFKQRRNDTHHAIAIAPSQGACYTARRRRAAPPDETAGRNRRVRAPSTGGRE